MGVICNLTVRDPPIDRFAGGHSRNVHAVSEFAAMDATFAKHSKDYAAIEAFVDDRLANVVSLLAGR